VGFFDTFKGFVTGNTNTPTSNGTDNTNVPMSPPQSDPPKEDNIGPAGLDSTPPVTPDVSTPVSEDLLPPNPTLTNSNPTPSETGNVGNVPDNSDITDDAWTPPAPKTETALPVDSPVVSSTDQPDVSSSFPTMPPAPSDKPAEVTDTDDESGLKDESDTSAVDLDTRAPSADSSVPSMPPVDTENEYPSPDETKPDSTV
jgi:hypothetical protein